jgi:pantoate--beta-alanine ligase
VDGSGPIVVSTRAELRAALADAPRPVGLVPTMGALHAGHASLMRRAHAECATVVVSIFVNPTQFERPDDLAAYPRTLTPDLEACRVAGADIAFVPSTEEVHVPGATTVVDPGQVAAILEGASRPGHFVAVATVVTILLGLATPERAYFGEKDAQQLRVVRHVVRDLAIATEIVGCPTVREADGLAMSSRNARLTPADRAAAPVVRRALLAARVAWEAGDRDAERLRAVMRAVLAAEPRARVDYVSVADTETLAELSGRVEGSALCSLAVAFGAVRLIDNETLPARCDSAITAPPASRHRR